MIESLYYSKILLFGEYSILLHGDALAIPWKKKYAFWNQGSFDDAFKLMELYFFLKKRSLDTIDLDAFYDAIQSGWYVDSNIPMGYGLGSSGSITAAIYKKFRYKKEVDLKVLRTEFSKIESFYHGTSSGFDPLISYIGEPICLCNNKLKIYPLNNFNLSNFFLVDSGIKRSPERLVTDTYEKLTSESKELGDKLVTLQNNAIKCLIDSGRGIDLYMQQISQFQSKFLGDLIPRNLQVLWENGLQDDSFYLKLCGAGGGGYYLGYAAKKSHIETLQEQYSVYWLEDYSSDLY